MAASGASDRSSAAVIGMRRRTGPRIVIAASSGSPESAPGPIFEARAWGPFLVLRTKEPVRDAEDFFRDTAAVELEGRILGVGDASINLQTAVTALSRLEGR